MNVMRCEEKQVVRRRMKRWMGLARYRGTSSEDNMGYGGRIVYGKFSQAPDDNVKEVTSIGVA